MTAELGQRERRRVQTRRALTRAAFDLFVLKGFDATTAEEIAAAAGFHRATFFRVFESKEDVVLGDVPERLEDLRRVLAAESPASDPWPIARRLLTAEATVLGESDDELDPMRVTILVQDPALQARFTAMALEWERAVAEFFAGSLAREATTDVTSRVLATSMIGVVRTAMLAAPATGRSVRDLLDEGFDLLEGGGLALRARR